MRIAVLLLLAAGTASPAQGAHWEQFPEYEGIDEIEPSLIETPGRLVEEYQSDLLVYTKPTFWQTEWLARDVALEVSAGSVSGNKFATSNRLKLHVKPLEKFEFRFTYYDESDFERTSVHHVFDFIFKPWQWLGLVFYGEPFSDKRNDDAGFAALFYPSETHEIRVFQTWVDVVRNISTGIATELTASATTA